ncbi:MAG: MerR family transcriptional regulator [Alphaproteobacteria bacterium]|nr:MerR family transcriptional regulator [Alphaproteobacteria bacterium]
MRISEAASKSGLSIDTIRYYESSGLLPPIERGADRQRRFSTVDVEWLILLASLRDTGMPQKTMRHFAGLYRQGDGTIPERKKVLLDHADHLEQRRGALDRCADILAHKLERSDEITGGNA